YPFVTSSSTSLAGALQGAGIAPKALKSSIGVAKAYCTRVGAGTFSTELTDEVGDRLREKGGEYGATTGRPRRCGWLDISDLKYAVAVNGFTGWNITKLDVLDNEEEIFVGVGINSDGSIKYEKLAGWQTSTEHITSFNNLPENAKKYIQFIEKESGVPVVLIGTGQGREDMIIRYVE
ncbi:MAG: adenylosuccinate synthetase, partial [Candidatus Peribacteraceae bacterium]|nr:adenylosuccinate synthetase [Candidatus Peribacteraceae bacterium]